MKICFFEHLITPQPDTMITTSHQPIKIWTTHPDNQLRLRWLWIVDRRAGGMKMRKVVIHASVDWQQRQRRWSPNPSYPRDSSVCRWVDVLLSAAERSEHVLWQFFHLPIYDFHCSSFRQLQWALWILTAMKAPLSAMPYLFSTYFFTTISLSIAPIAFNWQLNIFGSSFQRSTKISECLMVGSCFCFFYCCIFLSFIFHKKKISISPRLSRKLIESPFIFDSIKFIIDVKRQNRMFNLVTGCLRFSLSRLNCWQNLASN